ncbi:hypothetical protein [Candidatus Nitrospira bockiana]
MSETRDQSEEQPYQPPEAALDLPEASGWESIAEWTGGLPPDAIDALREIKGLQTVYPLLHTLVGRSPRDFFVRAAALKAIVASGHAALSSRDLDDVLYWLDESSRNTTVRALRASGWLDFSPAIGTVLTDAGRWAYEIIAFLRKQLEESELRPTLEGVDYALRIGIDPIWHLESLRLRLQSLREEIESARASYSEVVLRRAAAKLDETLCLSQQIRSVLDRVSPSHHRARRVAREIHDLLSRLHGGSAELHGAITEVGRQYLRLTAGLTIEQIVQALMGKTQEDLAEIGREALFAVFVPRPLLTTDVVAAAAEQHVLRERRVPEPVIWEEPPEAERVTDAAFTPQEVLSLLDDLEGIVQSGRALPLSFLVPRGSAEESFLRASLLPLVGDHRAGEGIAGQLGSLPVEVESEGDGWPEPLEEVPLSALTPGWVRPQSGEPNANEVDDG